MPISPLAAGTRVGPESEPKQFRIARPRRLGEVVIEYHAQDMIRGDACIILELAPFDHCIRDANGSVVPDADLGPLWHQAVEEFVDRSTAERFDAIRHVEELRSVWRAGGTAFWALKTVPNAPVIPYESDIVPGAPKRRASHSASLRASRPITPLADGAASSHSQLVQPVEVAPSASCSRPIQAFSGEPPGPRMRPVVPVDRSASVSESRRVHPSAVASRPSRPIRPVAGGPSASQTGRVQPIEASVESSFAPRPPKASPMMDAMQAELLALVEKGESEIEVVDEGHTPGRNTDDQSTISLLEAFGITQVNQFRIAIAGSILFALVVLVQVCGGS